jgi:vacuolar-type H+-ATPase subunit E/Vma4
MALDSLIAILRREADAEASAIQAAAAADASAIRARSEAELSDRRARVLAIRQRDRAAAVELALVSARQSARREILEARWRVLGRVLEAMRSRLPQAVATAEYLAAFPEQLGEALHCLGSRSGKLRLLPALADRARPLLDANPGVSLIPDSTIGAGFVLESEDGAIGINGTLEDRLDRLASRVALDVMADLEGQP